MPGHGTPVTPADTPAWTFTDIDLNDTSTTSTIYNPSVPTTVYGVFLEQGGGTSEIQLELTDGSDTVVLDEKGAGENLSFQNMLVLSKAESLQIDVTTAEGSAQSDTAGVCHAERDTP